MPAPSRHAAVHVQVRLWLADARARGLSFDEAWREVVRRPSRRGACVVWFPHKTIERRLELEVLESTRAEWEAAYVGVETRLSRAIEGLEAVDESTFAVRVGAGTAREGFVLPVPGVGSQQRGGVSGVRLDSREVHDALFARSHARRELRAA